MLVGFECKNCGFKEMWEDANETGFHVQYDCPKCGLIGIAYTDEGERARNYTETMARVISDTLKASGRNWKASLIVCSEDGDDFIIVGQQRIEDIVESYLKGLTNYLPEKKL